MEAAVAEGAALVFGKHAQCLQFRGGRDRKDRGDQHVHQDHDIHLSCYHTKEASWGEGCSFISLPHARAEPSSGRSHFYFV